MNSDYSQLEKADIFALGATMYQLATGADLPTGRLFAHCPFLRQRHCNMFCIYNQCCGKNQNCFASVPHLCNSRVSCLSFLNAGGEQYTNLRRGKLKLIPGYSTSFQTLLKHMLSHDPADRPSTKQILGDKLFKKQAAYNQLELRPSGS